MKNIGKLLIAVGVCMLLVAFSVSTECAPLDNGEQIEMVVEMETPVIHQASIFGIGGDGEGDGTLITIIFGALATLFGGAFAWFKKKFSKVVAVLRTVYDLANSIDDSLKDDALSKKEVLLIKTKIKAVKSAINELFKKEPGK